MITKGLGFIESGVNPNDATYAAPKIELPKRYELREQLRVYDQGSKGSCVSCTVAEMYNFYCKSKVGNRLSASNTCTTSVLTRLLTE